MDFLHHTRRMEYSTHGSGYLKRKLTNVLRSTASPARIEKMRIAPFQSRRRRPAEEAKGLVAKYRWQSSRR
jgi:hypothetical protein